jgi:aspartate/glutamate racemase
LLPHRLISRKNCFVLSVKIEEFIEYDLEKRGETNIKILESFQKQLSSRDADGTILMPNNANFELLIFSDFSDTKSQTIVDIIMSILDELESDILARMSLILHCTDVDVHMHSKSRNTPLVFHNINKRMSQFVMKQPWGGTLLVTQEAKHKLGGISLLPNKYPMYDKNAWENELYLFSDDMDDIVITMCRNSMTLFGEAIAKTIKRKKEKGRTSDDYTDACKEEKNSYKYATDSLSNIVRYMGNTPIARVLYDLYSYCVVQHQELTDPRDK